ncbi:peptidoglycan DD-metalloendopeptidase family protein [Teredinibacter turnerae]|uniref:peptidoglycan DD-metalloendopeptidase family protein n=1 Tax=Teredinibacter turnerae TaxID=2426 RepID=UPI000370873B|nr:peptidoglycan DD-metalloendopeptidase family protein [Teredinibacter turnerae]
MFRILIILCVIGVCLTGCTSGTYKAPVTDRGRPPGERIGHHIVAKGETLYSIAWRYNVDYHALAAANGVGSTYHIYPGQRLTLDVTRVPPKPSIKRTTKTVVSAPPKVDPSWHWPASGKLIATFSSNGGLNKGIDIQGKLGEPVHAAAAGIVVYSGSGLRGYGKLLIVKHNAKFLSAYAHNRRLLAKEGERVKRGQKIAEMGSSGTDAVKLHFEIRFDGTPVDPMKYLPRR